MKKNTLWCAVYNQRGHSIYENPRACPQIAFCKMPSQFASDFMLDLGGVVGYIDQIQRKIWCEVGRQIAGMNLGTRSSTKIRRNACRTFIIFAVSKDADDEISSTQKLYPEKASLFNSYFRISIYRHFLYNLFYIGTLNRISIHMDCPFPCKMLRL